MKPIQPAKGQKSLSLQTRLSMDLSRLTHSSPVGTCSPKSSGRLSQARKLDPNPLPCLAPRGFGVLLWSIRRFLAPTHPRIDYPFPPNPSIAAPYRIRVGGPSAHWFGTEREKDEETSLRSFCFFFEVCLCRDLWLVLYAPRAVVHSAHSLLVAVTGQTGPFFFSLSLCEWWSQKGLVQKPS